MNKPYKPSWNSLCLHRTPPWFRDAKFGIYTHWGIYSVPACGPNGSWYGFYMYQKGSPQHKHHVKTYGSPEKFGYKDFIPQFTGAKFDPDEWAELFRQAGAKFAGPVGEHHDGFSMWDTHYSAWNATHMGPGRDVVGALEKSIRGQGMKYMVALHHAENWWFFPHWLKEYDVADPRYAGLYGEPHNLAGPIPSPDDFLSQERPSRKFLETWRNKIIEVIDKYRPDLLWFDFGLGHIPDKYKQEFLAYYYNKEMEWGQEAVVTYKHHDLPPNIAVLDLELGRETDLTYYDWLTDSTVDDGSGWGYLKDARYKSVTSLVQYLVDNVSRNGHLLLNVGPKPDGTIPDQVKTILEGIGKWLEVNGEAIYGTTPWFTPGEGPTKLVKSGEFNEEHKLDYTARDIRFTVKDDALYVICLAWPKERFLVETLKVLYPNEVKSVKMLGGDCKLKWMLTSRGLEITTPPQKPCEHAYVFKVVRGKPYG